MRQKNNIRIYVQGASQTGDDYAKDLEKECDRLAKELKAITPPICVMTSAHDGRQTATIQIITQEEDNEEPVFNGFLLRQAFDKYKASDHNMVNHTPEALIDWLVDLKHKDLD